MNIDIINENNKTQTYFNTYLFKLLYHYLEWHPLFDKEPLFPFN